MDIFDAMPWMTWMRSHIGEVEQTGAVPTDFDREVFSHTSYGPLQLMDQGCAATACAALEENGYLSSHSAAAASFLHYGTECELKPGCIVVFNHHVTFCDHIIDDEWVACLGGNQGHMVKVSNFQRKDILACRWPIKH